MILPVVLALDGLVAPIDPLALVTMGLVQQAQIIDVDGVPANIEVVAFDAESIYQPIPVPVPVRPASPVVRLNAVTGAEMRWARKSRPVREVQVVVAKAAGLELTALDAEASFVAQTVTRSLHPAGLSGAIVSAQTVAAIATKARTDSTVREWAVRALREAGMPSSPAAQAEAIFHAVRRLVAPVRDPVGTEWITYPADLIKSAQPAGDCDCQVALFISAVQAVGIQAAVVLQTNADAEPHLLSAIWDDTRWLYADPARRDLSFGAKRKAEKEVWFGDGKTKTYVSREATSHAFDLKPASPAHQGQFIGVGDVGLPAAEDHVLVDMVEAAVPGAPKGLPWWVSFVAGIAVGAVGAVVVMSLVRPRDASPEAVVEAPVATPQLPPSSEQKPPSAPAAGLPRRKSKG